MVFNARWQVRDGGVGKEMRRQEQRVYLSMIARSATVHKNGQKISQLMSEDGLPPKRAGVR
jgi:hypothetical protein